ncbi:peptidase domain-containing ABC transporter [Methylocapsa sp. S129]|uniref:peptidase domain-containing ABC transporter n=1 Tax=Methylocapsa sp. S129 TaxID=1641869 RepID=UPI00131DBC0B|nr:peptidase domain-containing ABC transporter [Methylocapsa sp. S129]
MSLTTGAATVATEFAPEGPVEPTGLACLVIVARHHGLHLTIAQLIRDNLLTGEEVSASQLLKCARSAGLKASALRLSGSRLSQLKKTLPAVVRLKNGANMVLRRIDGEADQTRIVLQDPNASDDAPLIIDRPRFEEVWTGETILVKRNYEISDESQPFSIGFVLALLFRERWIIRDIAICAIVLSFLALTPIIFWRLLSDKVIYYKAYNTLSVLCVAMAVLVAFEAMFAYLRQLLILHLTTRVDVKLAKYMFDKILNLPIDFFERTQVGRITYDAQQIWRIRTFLMGQLFGTVLDSTTMLVFVPIMFFFSTTMTLIVLGSCAAMSLWIIGMLPYTRRKSNAVEAAESQRGAFLVQTIHGIRTVKSLALDTRQRHIWDVHTARVAKLRFAEGMAGNLLHSVVRPFERFAVSGSFAVGVYLALSSDDPVYIGALFAFLLLSQRVSGPLLQMAKLVNQYDEARLAVAVVAQLVNQTPEEGRGGHGVRTPLEGHVQFSNVTFKYQGASSPALRGVSFDAPLGATLGIMGRSGSGKTTITRLLQRLHSNYEGLIKIDGIDVREYDIDHLRRSLGVVLQDNFLFSGTIRENIAAAKSDASFDEVVRAARLAGAEEFIDKLPRGYETIIYEGSPNLSGGQRQRLAIARALIVDPRILILDEATSALDADSEAIVNANIARIAQGRTLIVISHRLSSLVTADAILVLERGEVHDFGRHEELLERCDIYSNLWHQQTQHMTASTRVEKQTYNGPRRVG